MASLPYVPGSPTSRAAAVSMRGAAPAIRSMVLEHIRRAGAGGLTCDDIEQLTGMRHQTISARIVELRDLGAIRESHARRATRSGRKAAVMIAVVAGDGRYPAKAAPASRTGEQVELFPVAGGKARR